MSQTKEGFYRHPDGTMGAYYGGAKPPAGSEYLGEQPPAPTQEQIALAQQIEAKREKELALKSIKVTVNGKEFDGHESARLNMTNALMVAGFTGQTQTNWKLADNTVAQVTIADVQQALALSIQKVGEIIGAV